MYKIAEQVKIVRNEIIESILNDLKNKSYIYTGIFYPEKGYEYFSFYGSYLFKTKHCNIIFGKNLGNSNGMYIHTLEFPTIAINVNTICRFPLSEIKKYIKNNTKTLDHELTHHLDSIRGTKFHPKSEIKKYYNSIEEMNAYFCSEVLSFTNIFDFKKRFDYVDCFQYLTDKNKKRILKRAYQYYYYE